MPLTFLVFDDDFHERFYWSIQPVFQLLLCDAHCEADPIWQVLCPVALPAIANYARFYRKNSLTNKQKTYFFQIDNILEKANNSWRNSFRVIAKGFSVFNDLVNLKEDSVEILNIND